MSSSWFKPPMSVNIPTLLDGSFLSAIETDTDTSCHVLGAGHFKKRFKGFVVWKIVIIEKTQTGARGSLLDGTSSRALLTT